jgi:hypothetical protein
MKLRTSRFMKVPLDLRRINMRPGGDRRNELLQVTPWPSGGQLGEPGGAAASTANRETFGSLQPLP